MDGLKGQRVLITRAAEDCAAWATRLKEAGAVPLTLPCIECEPIPDPAVVAQLAMALPKTDWLVVTSRRGADALRPLIASTPWTPADEQAMAAIRIAAVGPATATATESLPGRVVLVSPSGTAKSLAEALAARLATATANAAAPARPRCVIAVAENAGPVLEDTLTRAGGDCLRINVYRTVPAAPAARKQALSLLGADKIVLASPSAVTGLVNRVELDAAVEIVSIGPSTSEAARAAGLSVTAEAPRPSLEGLLEAMQ